MEKSAGSWEVRKPGSEEERKLWSREVSELGDQEVRKVGRKIGVEEIDGGRPRRPYI